MIDHVTLDVSDCRASRAFYERALAPLGWSVIAEWPGGCGFGMKAGGPTIWLREEGRVSGPIHLAFRSKDRAGVRSFHAAALMAGGRNNGDPGLREYHPNYYGAFVFDPDGHNVEAVCHASDDATRDANVGDDGDDGDDAADEDPSFDEA